MLPRARRNFSRSPHTASRTVLDGPSGFSSTAPSQNRNQCKEGSSRASASQYLADDDCAPPVLVTIPDLGELCLPTAACLKMAVAFLGRHWPRARAPERLPLCSPSTGSALCCQKTNGRFFIVAKELMSRMDALPSKFTDPPCGMQRCRSSMNRLLSVVAKEATSARGSPPYEHLFALPYS